VARKQITQTQPQLKETRWELRTFISSTRLVNHRSGPTSRTRLVGARSRRALARDLRRAAASTERSAKARGCQVPLLLDRVTAVRSELLALASELEHGSDHDATKVALVHRLLRDGASPLYDPNVPVSSLYDMLSRARGAGRRSPSSATGAGTVDTNPGGVAKIKVVGTYSGWRAGRLAERLRC